MDKKNNKVIHYIWYGGNPLSDLTKKCIETWKKFLPDFEIMEWNEKTFDVNQCPFIKEAYEQKKWAFVADYTRFKVLEEYGGIYLDTDMEITGDISKFLEKDLFLGVEDSKMINAAVVWSKEAHNPHIQEIVKIYESKKHFNETGDLYDESVPRVLTKYFGKFGFDGEKDEIQTFDDDKVWIYPMEYFYPLSYDYQNNKFTDNSVMIHHFDATWISPMEKFKTKMKRKNMIWVVYVIDFFINLKNKIKFFSNYRDFTIFTVMFFTMLLAMYAITPISDINQELGIFGTIEENLGKSILQLVGFSLIWTYICAKIRTIDVNKYMDKMTGFNFEDNNYKPPVLTLEQFNKLKKRETIIYVVQFILTICISLLPLFQLINIYPNRVTIFGILTLVNIYYVYLGIAKEFKYRILELIPYAVILNLMIVFCPAFGILQSIVTFGFIMYKMISSKIKPKRLKSFGISYIITFILFFILSFLIINSGNIKEINIGTSIVSNEKVEIFDNLLLEGDKITEFNAGKEFFLNNIKNTVNSNIALYSNLYLIISLVMVGILFFITHKKEHLFLGVIQILDSIYLMKISTESILYISCVSCCVIVLFVVERLLNKLLDR